MSTPPIDPVLLEAVTSAWRPRDRDGRTLPHPAWADLPPAGREAASEAARAQRVVEAALDPNGWSSTVRAVLGRLRPGPPG
jgi:hypothetical protein